MLRSPTISKAFGYPASLVLAVDGSIDLTEPTLGRDAVRRNRRGSENNVGEIRSKCGKTGVGTCPMHPGKIRLRALCRVSDKVGAAYLRREICVSNQSVNRQPFVRLRCETMASRASRLRCPKPQQPFPRACTASVTADWIDQTDHAVEGMAMNPGNRRATAWTRLSQGFHSK